MNLKVPPFKYYGSRDRIFNRYIDNRLVQPVDSAFPTDSEVDSDFPTNLPQESIFQPSRRFLLFMVFSVFDQLSNCDCIA